MAKKGSTKNRGRKKPKSERKKAKDTVLPEDQVDIGGDLRVVDLHLAAWKKGQAQEAQGALQAMGRDASFLVQQAADESDDPELIDFARRLAAVPPQVDTNLYALREAAVRKRIEAAAEEPMAVDAEVQVPGGAVALFDPEVLVSDLAKSGRPRRDPGRVNAGDLTWFGVPVAEAVSVSFSTKPVPDGQDSLRSRLRVTSGVVFVGPLEASDGPRLGTVRLDPFSTTLDEYSDRGAFVRMRPGTYATHAYWQPDEGLMVHLIPDPDTKAAVAQTPAELSELPIREG